MAENETLGNIVNVKCFACMARNSSMEQAVFPVQNSGVSPCQLQLHVLYSF